LTIDPICISNNIPKDAETPINVANKNSLFEGIVVHEVSLEENRLLSKNCSN
jgi:hypothetical protein